MDEEIPLHGGHVNDAVVRVGNTVRRHCHRLSSSIHVLLTHLKVQGYPFSPEFLGIDDRGREILGFIPADNSGFEFIWQSSTVLTGIATMLRQYHEAVSGFNHCDYDWLYHYPDEQQHEIICHNDFAPYNLLFKNQLPVGIIDFDLAGPGPKLRDVAYSAYWCVPLSFHASDMKVHSTNDIGHGSRRMVEFCRAYGTTDYARVLELVAEVLLHMSDQRAMSAMLGKDKALQLKAEGHLEHWKKEYHAYCHHRQALENNLYHCSGQLT